MGSYVSYAMFTVTEEKNNAISIVTGNLYYDLKVDGAASNTLTVPANSFKEFIITLTNTNNRTTRLNLYYVGNVSDEVDVAYIEEGYNSIPTAAGENFANGASKQYKIRVSNTSSSSVTVNLGVEAGLDYNDLSIPSDGHEIRKITIRGLVTDVVKDDIMNRLNTSDSEQTFVTGENPNNYIWYSGKLWRVVSVDPSDNSVKLVTQWNISSIPYNTADHSAFRNSHMETWLNDTSVDGFLGNLRDVDTFIKTNSQWNATQTTATTKPPKTTMITKTVGLLNVYEYTMSYSGTTAEAGYLNNNLYWWTLTPNSATQITAIDAVGGLDISITNIGRGIRPAINLKPSVTIVGGSGTEDDPFRLAGDNDSNLSGTLLSNRYSGEYVSFGSGENNLYRIISHENGLNKLVAAKPLTENGTYVTKRFHTSAGNVIFSPNTSAYELAYYLNHVYLDTSQGFMTDDQKALIEVNTWYLGTVGTGDSYRLAKYTTATGSTLTSTTTASKAGTLRMGELFAGQTAHSTDTVQYWLLTPHNTSYVRRINTTSYSDQSATNNARGVVPVISLNSNVKIVGGDGTKNNPFQISA